MENIDSIFWRLMGVVVGLKLDLSVVVIRAQIMNVQIYQCVNSPYLALDI